LRPTRRTQLSKMVAEALLDCYGNQRATVASELALLFEAARDWSRASEFYFVAANNAMDIFANHEAGALAQRGLEVLASMPESTERAKQELKLQNLLGQTLMATKGFAVPEVEHAALRARELSLQLNELAPLFRSEFSLAIVYVVRAEYQRAFDHGNECLRIAEKSRNEAMLMQAHWLIGLSQCYLGAFAAARDHFEQTITIHDSAVIEPALYMYGAVLSRAHLARMLLFLGYPDQSQQMMTEAIARAERHRHPVGVANTLALAAYLEAFHRRPEKALERAAATSRQADEHGLPYYAAVATLMRGWALAMQNQEEEGISLIRQGLESSLAIGTRQQHGYFLALLAEALTKAGRLEEGLDVLREALSVAQQSHEPFYEAELDRLKGEALAKATVASNSEAESCFHRALEIARQQQAKSFELRAAISLARLCQRHGKTAEARQMLAEIYGWFTEGFDTPDLKDAKALLNELSAVAPQ